VRKADGACEVTVHSNFPGKLGARVMSLLPVLPNFRPLETHGIIDGQHSESHALDKAMHARCLDRSENNFGIASSKARYCLALSGKAGTASALMAESAAVGFLGMKPAFNTYRKNPRSRSCTFWRVREEGYSYPYRTHL
jgi:hypothetical protein